MKMPDLSIVVPVMNEVGNIELLATRIHETVGRLPCTWELVFVDDGSTDKSWDLIRKMYDRDEKIRGVRFTRNFGHQHALMAGLQAAQGKAVISMDADLQHPPELIADMVREWQNGFQIVHTQRLDSSDTPFLKRLTSRMFYRIFSALSDVKLDPGMADFRLLDREVVEQVLKFHEQTPYLRVIVHDVGYSQTTISYTPTPRMTGATKYTYKRMLSMAWGSVSGYSLMPLRLSIYLGIATSVLAFSGVFYALYSKFVLNSVVPGWASLLSVISILFGLLFFMVGMLGEYIGRILREVTHRPRYLVREELRRRPALESTNPKLEADGSGDGS